MADVLVDSEGRVEGGDTSEGWVIFGDTKAYVQESAAEVIAVSPREYQFYTVDQFTHSIIFDEILGFDFNLKKPIAAKINYDLENQAYRICNEELEIYESAKDFEKAIDEFFDFFINDFLNWM